MIAVSESSRHEEVWLLLPWLANGRLAVAERDVAESHVRRCQECTEELSRQQQMCAALAEPDRVTYAPGPSLRKLMARIDAEEASLPTHDATGQASPNRSVRLGLRRVSLWRPPGLAWAASFLALFGLTAMMSTAYRWSQPLYTTHTAAVTQAPDILHIALNRSVPIGEVEELLRSSGARIVEGPGSTGILGVAPVEFVAGRTPAAALNSQLHALSARLRADPRVLWVQPLADDGAAADAPAPGTREY